MIKQLIEEENYHINEAEGIHEKVLETLKPIFKRLLGIYLVGIKGFYDTLVKYIGKEHTFAYGSHSVLDGYRISDDILYLHYYDCCYDSYYCDEFAIPLQVVENELSPLGNGDETMQWYKGLFDLVKEKEEEEKRKKEEAKKQKEIEQYLKLKEKYGKEDLSSISNNV